MQQNSGLFKSFKNKLGRKNSYKSTEESTTSSSRSYSNSSSTHLQASHSLLQTTTPTRRPASFSMAGIPKDAPPAYNAATNAQSSLAANTDNDPYAFLSQFDTVFLIDDSGSMAGRNWRETQQALEAITPICTSHDADGIDLYFLNAKEQDAHHNVTMPIAVREIFTTVSPRGQTPLGQRLHTILQPYLKRCNSNLEGTKPMNVIIITDGAPSDDVESVIIHAAKKLDKLDAPAWQIGLQFFQVGRDAEAQAYLQHLDDNLTEIAGREIRDIVDTQCWTNDEDQTLNADGILKTILGAVNRRLDRKKSGALFGE